MNTKVKAIVAR